MSHLEFAINRFGLGAPTNAPRPAQLPLPEPGTILALIGDSGAGKSLALEALARRRGATIAKPLTCQQLGRPVLDLFDPALPAARVLRLLAAAGLADATLWTRNANTLSQGERRRLELALALAGAVPESTLILDEFDAHLDFTTALALACSLRKLAFRQCLRLVVSTHRPELLPALGPGRVIEISSGQALPRPELLVAKARDLLCEFSLQRGKLADYARFARWHYLGARRPGPVTDVFLALWQGRPAGIALFGYPHLFLSARNLVLPQRYSSQAVAQGGARLLNAEVRLLQRVVIEPRFRALGLASRLLAASAPQVGVPFVECLAEMGEFSGFLERAGFARRGRCKPSREAKRLQATLAQCKLEARSLMDAAKREARLAALPQNLRRRIKRQLLGLCRSRIETGKGNLRGSTRAPQSLLQSALMRLHCQPEYFLWERSRHEHA